MESRFFDTKSLPSGIVKALHAVGYRSPTVSVRVADDVSIFSCGGSGVRGFAVVVHEMHSPTREELWGSWGGPNPFTKPSGVDNPAERRTVPERGAVITGSSGRSVYAVVSVRGDVFRALVPAETQIAADMIASGASVDAVKSADPACAVTNGDSWVLACFAYKSAYRKEQIANLRDATNGVVGSDAHIDSLVARGFISRNKAGACSLTTSGRNARAKHEPYMPSWQQNAATRERNARWAMLLTGQELPTEESAVQP